MNSTDPLIVQPPPVLHPAVSGAFKSKTMWASVLFTTLCECEPYIEPLWLAAIPALHLDAPTVRFVGLLGGFLMAFFRILTKNSLTDKGAPFLPKPPQPPTFI